VLFHNLNLLLFQEAEDKKKESVREVNEHAEQAEREQNEL